MDVVHNKRAACHGCHSGGTRSSVHLVLNGCATYVIIVQFNILDSSFLYQWNEFKKK